MQINFVILKCVVFVCIGNLKELINTKLKSNCVFFLYECTGKYE